MIETIIGSAFGPVFVAFEPEGEENDRDFDDSGKGETAKELRTAAHWFFTSLCYIGN